MFLTISQNLQENACASASFSLLKRDSGTDIFCEFCDFFKNNFSQNISKQDPEGRIMWEKFVHLQSVPKIRRFLYLAQQNSKRNCKWNFELCESGLAHLKSCSQYFEIFWWLSEFFFHHFCNEAIISNKLIHMGYWTTSDLGSLENRKFQKNLK